MHGLKIPGEYKAVSARLYRAGVGHLAHAAHALPVTPDEAQTLIRTICGPEVQTRFGGYRGRARGDAWHLMPSGRWVRMHRRERVTMPAASGTRMDGVPYLRLGIVLHECAHILTMRAHPRAKPHGPEFCDTLARLLKEF